jgi:nicotinamide-nucleotide amidase
MTVGVLSIGNELLRGEIANTNGSWLARQLTEMGLDVRCIEVVPDDRDALVEAIRRMCKQHSVVVATGGLGPTTDDLTAQAAGAAADVKLSLNEDALDAIRRRVEAAGREMRPGHEKQALLPEGTEVLTNGEGTAPGFLLRLDGASAFFLPGVPREMKGMFDTQVSPRVRGLASANVFYARLHTIGRGESWLADKLHGIEEHHPNVVFRYRAKSSEVDVIIEARGADPAAAREAAMDATADARSRLGNCVYGEGDESMPQLAGRSVRSRGWRLAVAESCTGGLIAQLLTSQPASDYFVGGAVTYANTAKSDLLGVSEDTLRGHGAVSAEVAAEMAEGARRAFHCDVALAVTGIAGPTGATDDKPLGLCHWAVATPNGTKCEQRVFSGNRNQVQRKAAQAVLDLLRRTAGSTVPAERPSRAGSEELAG